MFLVREEKCDQCLFSPRRIVRRGRMQEILRDCARTDRHFECHKATITGEHICCYGFYDRDPYATNLMRVAARLNCVRFVHEGACAVVPKGMG